jgi:hypothetical protein
MKAERSRAGKPHRQRGGGEAVNDHKDGEAVPLNVKTGTHSNDRKTHWPATTAATTSTKPIADTSMTRPDRQKRM